MRSILAVIVLFSVVSLHSAQSTCSQPCDIGGFAGTCYPSSQTCPVCYIKNSQGSWDCYGKASGSCPWAGMTDCSVTTATSAPPPPPPPPPSGNSACPKRGLAYTFTDPADMSAVRNGISWWYNWDDVLASAETNYQLDEIEYVPMIWNGVDLNSVSDTISSIPKGANYLLGFNEPNFYAQANMPATTAASLWPQMEQVANSRNLKIVSPAVDYCGGGCWETDPFVYLDEFFAACTNCQVDYVAAHVYSCTAAALQDYLTNLKKYGKPIWITEIACAQWDSAWQDNQQFITDYMEAAVQILENDPQVFRYAWFSGRTTGIPMVNVFGNTGQLTNLGALYVSMPCGSANAELSESSAGENPSPALSSTSWIFIGFGIGVGTAFLVVLIVFVVKILKTHVRNPVEIA